MKSIVPLPSKSAWIVAESGTPSNVKDTVSGLTPPAGLLTSRNGASGAAITVTGTSWLATTPAAVVATIWRRFVPGLSGTSAANVPP